MIEPNSKFGLSPKNLEIIIETLKKIPEIQMAKIYGSRAKGNFRPGSDIDIALFGPQVSTDTLFQLDKILDDLSLPYEFDLSIYAQLSNLDLKNHIDRIGIRIV